MLAADQLLSKPFDPASAFQLPHTPCSWHQEQPLLLGHSAAQTVGCYANQTSWCLLDINCHMLGC